MFRYIIWTFILYWLFRFIFNFLLPLFRVTRQMKDQVRDFQSAASNQGYQSQERPGQQTSNASARPQQREGSRPGDYIEFEEIK